MTITENNSQYYIGQEEGDNFPDKRGGKSNGTYFFRGDSGDVIFTSQDEEEWRQFKEEWKSQNELEEEPEEEEVVDEQPEEEEVVDEQPEEEPEEEEVVDKQPEEEPEEEEVVDEQPEEEPEEEEVVDEQPEEEVDNGGEEMVDSGGEDTTIYTSSNGGMPIENPDIPADTRDGNPDTDKLDFSSKYASPNGGNDMISGTSGANTFEINLLLNAKPEIIEDKSDKSTGKIFWENITNQNQQYHNHWLESIGEDTIVDFSGTGGEGDKIDISGHTIAVTVLEESDDRVVLGLYSDQSQDGFRAAQAHDLDVVGKLTINHDGNFDYGNDVSVNPGVYDGVREFV